MASDRKRSKCPSRFVCLIVSVLVLGILLAVLNIYELHRLQADHSQAVVATAEGSQNLRPTGTGLVVWVAGNRTSNLEHVYTAFQRLGYTVGDGTGDWNVLWSHDYPFGSLSKELASLKKHQRVNHFPGSGFVTNKVHLATSAFSFVPQAFKLPGDRDKFLEFSASHPDIMWVQKSNNHRGIQIKTASALNLTREGSFIQKYVDKPFLIDGHKFDIGIYTVLTSVNPLRVYVLDDDALFRFCPTNYYPFDANIRDKYVVRDDYLPLWKISSLHDLYSDKGYNFKVTFNEYMKSRSLNHTKIWADIKSAIKRVYLDKEHKLTEAAAKFNSSHHFFELVRFDFVLDEDLQVYLMEANMSPNLSSRHFDPNRRLYEHVLYTLLNLVGLSQYVAPTRQESEEDARVAPTDIRVFPDTCVLLECRESCTPLHCQLCRRCVSEAVEADLKLAYLEHARRGGARRVIPPAISARAAATWDPLTNWPGLEGLSESNRLMHLWFLGKCVMDKTFCE